MLRLLGFLIALLIALPTALAQPTVFAVRLGEHPDKTRFVLELSEAPRYRVFTLPDPFRVVIDLPELEWRPPSDVLRDGSGLVSAMRFGLFAPGTSRVVLDMSSPIRIKNVFVIPPDQSYPHRLVVDIEAVSRPQFLAAGRQPFVSDPPLDPLRAAVAPPPKPTSDPRPTVVIDPGHGGVDPGALSATGIKEKQIALAYSQELKRQLERTGRYRVVMTRQKDIFIRLRDRVAMAQDQGGDLFISMHANNHKSRKIRGASVYTLSERASDNEAEALAAKENKADLIAGVNLTDQTEVVSRILIDLAQRETMNLSAQFANVLVGEFGKVAPLLKNAHRYAGFAVLKSPTVPSVLLEIGYLSNKAEERLLRSDKHRQKLMGAAVQAIDAFFARQDALNRS